MNGTNELLGGAVAPKLVTRLHGRTCASAAVSEPTVPAGVRLAQGNLVPIASLWGRTGRSPAG